MTYQLSVTLTNQLDCLDGGQWQMLMGWRKTLLLNPGDLDLAAVILGDDVTEDTIRATVRKLIKLLNQPTPARNELGYPMWDRSYALSNKYCWEWKMIAPHSHCLVEIMRAAGIKWPDDGTMPDIDHPQITINLSIQ